MPEAARSPHENRGGPSTHERILKAAEALMVALPGLEQITVRRIAAMAEVNVAAISYHFGSRDRLILAVMERVYRRFNAERLRLLQAAVDARKPEPPQLERVITALIGPSVRWQLDPASSYSAFLHFTALAQQSPDPAVRDEMAGQVEHLKAFIPPLREIAPWLSANDVAWRIHCALGIRTQVTRSRRRGQILVGDLVDFTDAEALIARMVEVIVPMFEPPRSASNAV